MPKNWWFKFDFRTWRTDSSLRRCSLETRGFWMEILCSMYESGTFEVTGTWEELGWLAGCPPAVADRCVRELQRTNTADVTLGSDTVTLKSRRLEREAISREQTRLRVEKFRRNGPVTDPYETPLTSVISNKKEVREEEEREEANFDKNETPPPAPKPKRGSRLSDDFELTPEMIDWAIQKRPGVDLAEETEKFSNYFQSAPGSKGLKLDWIKTWRNWILTAKEKYSHERKLSERERRAINDHNTIERVRDRVAERDRQLSGQDVDNSQRLIGGLIADGDPS